MWTLQNSWPLPFQVPRTELKSMWTMSTLLASHRLVEPSNRVGFGTFSQLPSVCKAWNTVRVPPWARCFLRSGAFCLLTVDPARLFKGRVTVAVNHASVHWHGGKWTGRGLDAPEPPERVRPAVSPRDAIRTASLDKSLCQGALVIQVRRNGPCSGQ